MIDLISNIQKKGELYYPKSSIQDKEISYPETGHDILFELEESSFWFQHRNKCILSLVKHFSPNDIFVDIGGGNGFTSHFLKRNGIDSILIEPGEHGAFNASKRGIESVCATIEELEFKEEAVKAVGLFDVVEHIDDDLSFMKEVNKVVSSDGYIYITVPAYDLLWSDEDIHAGHFRRHTMESISKLIQNSGFEMVYSSYFFQSLILPILLFRSLPFRLGFRSTLNKENAEIDHNKKGLSIKVINKFLSDELKKIQNLKELSFGASIILVAKKCSNL